MNSDQPWLRLPNEPTVAYACFRAYLDAGPARQVTKVARSCNRSASLLYRWSSRWSWGSRADAFEREADRLWSLERSRARRNAAERHARVAAAVIELVAQRLQTIDVDRLSPRDLSTWLDVAARIERTALGEPDRLQVSGHDGGPVQMAMANMTTDERLQRLRQLRDEIRAPSPSPGARIVRPSGDAGSR